MIAFSHKYLERLIHKTRRPFLYLIMYLQRFLQRKQQRLQDFLKIDFLQILVLLLFQSKLQMAETVTRGVLSKSCSYKFCSIHRKTPVLESFYNKVAGLESCNCIKRVIAWVYSWEYYEMFKNICFGQHRLRAVSEMAALGFGSVCKHHSLSYIYVVSLRKNQNKLICIKITSTKTGKLSSLVVKYWLSLYFIL